MVLVFGGTALLVSTCSIAMASVDIVIPLFNKASVFGKCLDSVFRQTVPDWTLTIIDDGSTDQSLRIAKPYLSDPRVTLISQQNRGPGTARNRGFSEGSSPYVAFLDADDIWLPEFLERALERFERFPYSAAVCGSWYWGDDSQDYSVRHRRSGILTGTWRMRGEIEPAKLKMVIDYCHSSAVVVKRSIVESLGGFYSEDHCTYGEDSWLWLQLVLRYPIYLNVEPVIIFGVETSELGFARKTPYPVPPVLKHELALRALASADHKRVLRRYLDWYAMFVAERAAAQGERQIGQALILRRLFRVSSLRAFASHLRFLATR